MILTQQNAQSFDTRKRVTEELKVSIVWFYFFETMQIEFLMYSNAKLTSTGPEFSDYYKQLSHILVARMYTWEVGRTDLNLHRLRRTNPQFLCF